MCSKSATSTPIRPFDLADTYGKDQFLLIDWLGTDRLPRFFALKSAFDAVLAQWRRLPANPIDRLLHAAAKLWPGHLPKRMRQWRDRFEHHLFIKVSAAALPEMEDLLANWRARMTICSNVRLPKRARCSSTASS